MQPPSPPSSEPSTATAAHRLQPFHRGTWRGMALPGWLERIDLRDPLAWATTQPHQIVRDRPVARTVRVDLHDQAVFLKHIIGPKDAPTGLRGMLYQLRFRYTPSRIWPLLRVTAAMNAQGIDTPTILLAATSRSPRAEILLMRQAPGRILRKALKHAPDAAARRHLLQQTARLIARLHDAGGVHGDLVPANIMIDPATGQVTLLDNDRTRMLARAQPRHRRYNLAQLLFRLLRRTTAAERALLLDTYFAHTNWSPARPRQQRARILHAVRRRQRYVQRKP